MSSGYKNSKTENNIVFDRRTDGQSFMNSKMPPKVLCKRLIFVNNNLLGAPKRIDYVMVDEEKKTDLSEKV